MSKLFSISGLSDGATVSAVSSQPSWLTVVPDGITSSFLVSVSAYTDTSQNRTGTITVTASDGATASLTVEQIKKSSLALSAATLYFDAAGNDYTADQEPTSPY